ncbi:MAG: carboxypeptidase regulatory-like domain-containing protein [Planctomycetes bacterium]|nr:carboxypeptidase regulatory-like domain-containing protein [Planctomycetota bacterium]
MKRLAPILVVAGLLALVVFVALRSRDAGTRTVAPQVSESNAATSGESTVGLEPTSAPVAASERTSVAPLAEPADAATGWTVCVVDASTNAPIGGARVSVSDSQASGRATIAQGIGADTLEGLRRRRELAVELETGPDGCAHFATPPTSASVEARHGELWGFAQVNQPPADGRVTLPIGPDRDLRVRVVDAAGVPVGGVPVAVRRQTDARPAYTWKWTDSAPTTGVATFLHFQRRLTQGTGWHALLAFPVRDQHAIPVDKLTPLEPPLELVLPDTGRVLVRVRAADGSVPELGEAELRIEAFESESRGTPLWPAGPWSTPRFDAAGEARVPWIGAGLFVRATLVREGTVLASRSIAGPTRDGEEVVCELAWRERAPRLVTGRFVFHDGRAWPAATVVAQPLITPTPAPRPESRELDVDAQGRFRMAVDEVRPENGSLVLRFTAKHPDGLGEVHAANAIDAEIPPDGLELGDVVLDLGELLAEGRVVDASRRPVEGATVELRSHTIASGESFWPHVRTSGRKLTDVDGRFQLHLALGEAPVSENLRIGATALGQTLGQELEIPRGARGVELVLTRTGGLAGSVEFGRGVAPNDVMVFLRGGGAARNLLLDTDATFEADELAPGAYSLIVSWRSELRKPARSAAARVDDLLVLPGETCRDPRVQRLRIENALETLRIRVVDRASTPIADAAIAVVGRTGATRVRSDRDGVCLVRCESLPVDLDVAAFGFASTRIEGVSLDRDVALEAGFPVLLHLDVPPNANRPPCTYYAILKSVDARGEPTGLAWGAAFKPAYFDGHGELALRLPALGTYECEVQLALTHAGVGRGARIELVSTPRITADTSERRFDLTLSAAAVDAAIAKALQ